MAEEPQEDNNQTPEADSAATPPPGGKMRLVVLLAVAAVLGVASGGLAVYVNNASPDNEETASACPFSAERHAALQAAAQGEVAAFAVLDEPRPTPLLAFNDDAGNDRTMADWEGQTVLFNLWATWCAPCREEMPALDRLQTAEGDDAFEVVAVSIDTNASADPQGCLEEIEVESLAFFQDDTADLFQTLRAEGLAFGMPTTLLIDDTGCLLGFLAGPAHWDSPDAVALMDAAHVH